MTPISDHNAFYGKYVNKKNKAVPLQIARNLERECYEASAKHRIAQGDIDRAHIELDHLGIPRNQKNPAFPLSLAGRIRYLTHNEPDLTEQAVKSEEPSKKS